MLFSNLRVLLLDLVDDEYREFTKKLLPGIDNILGVRIPELRKLAKQISNEDINAYLKEASDDSFEEIMLQGLVIGYAKNKLPEVISMLENFLPKIDNWSVCDALCSGLKITNKHKDEMWDFILPLFRDTRTYYVRFAVVMSLKYFVDQEYINLVFNEFDKIKCKEYYSQMAVAWAISCYFIKFREETFNYLRNNKLDDFTFNKALQKITESYCVDKETKAIIKEMKRK